MSVETSRDYVRLNYRFTASHLTGFPRGPPAGALKVAPGEDLGESCRSIASTAIYKTNAFLVRKPRYAIKQPLAGAKNAAMVSGPTASINASRASAMRVENSISVSPGSCAPWLTDCVPVVPGEFNVGLV